MDAQQTHKNQYVQTESNEFITTKSYTSSIVEELEDTEIILSNIKTIFYFLENYHLFTYTQSSVIRSHLSMRN